jgi:hypothetical protein
MMQVLSNRLVFCAIQRVVPQGKAYVIKVFVFGGYF